MLYYIYCYDINGLMGTELTRILKGLPVIVRCADTIDTFKSIFDSRIEPDIIVWTITSKNLYDMEMLHEIKAKCPVIVVSDYADREYIIEAVEKGVDDYITYPYQDKIVLKKLLRAMNYPANSILDDDVGNVLVIDFNDMVIRELSAAARGNYKLSILLIVVESDDAICGEITKLMSLIIQSRLRNTDSVFRMGTSRLIVLLPFTHVSGRIEVCRKLEIFFNEHSIIRKLGSPNRIIFSGVTYPDDGKVKEKLLDLLEQRLVQGH